MRVFVDSNVLVYARDASEGRKQEQAAMWLAHLWQERTGRLSFQVLHEYYVSVTRKLDPGLPEAEARRDARALLAWRPVPLDAGVLSGAWDLQDRYALSFWDALVVSAAQEARCTHLLTEDLQDGQDLGGVLVISPFAEHGRL